MQASNTLLIPRNPNLGVTVSEQPCVEYITHDNMNESSPSYTGLTDDIRWITINVKENQLREFVHNFRGVVKNVNFLHNLLIHQEYIQAADKQAQLEKFEHASKAYNHLQQALCHDRSLTTEEYEKIKTILDNAEKQSAFWTKEVDNLISRIMHRTQVAKQWAGQTRSWRPGSPTWWHSKVRW